LVPRLDGPDARHHPLERELSRHDDHDHDPHGGVDLVRVKG
jgi:hypothetical protein